MRKYQQLLLLVLSCSSVAILLTYRSENNRLKFVLQAVNFFGRNDAAVLRQIDNATKEIGPDYRYPIGIWQMIGDSFHAYSAYWLRNELVAGGESLVLVAGKRGAIINFKCGFYYEDGSRSVLGKFKFVRIDSSTDDEHSEFTLYHFECHLTRDFGKPEQIFFVDVTSLEKHERSLRLRSFKNEADSTDFSICLNLFNFNRSTSFGKLDSNLAQFFLTHRALGIENFLVYNSDMLPRKVEHLLKRSDVNLHLMPFNFPFLFRNATDRIRRFMETDCLLRNSNRAKYTILLDPDEFVYFSNEINNIKSTLSKSGQKMELLSFNICMDERNKLLIDNHHYDPEFPKKNVLYVYRLPLIKKQIVDRSHIESTLLTVSKAMAHHYIRCEHIRGDGPRSWKTMLREDFQKNINSIRYRVDLLV